MTITPENREAIAPIKWAQPYLDSPEWCVRERTHRSLADDDADVFPRDTMRGAEGIQHWIELYEKPSPGSTAVPKTITILRFGTAAGGFPTIAHGGAVMLMFDEALSFAWIANESEGAGRDTKDWASAGKFAWKRLFKEGKSVSEALKGFLVTAQLDFKFMRPVLCPGVVGIEVDVLENKGHKIKLRGVMKDGEGTPLVQAEGLWVRLGGRAKI